MSIRAYPSPQLVGEYPPPLQFDKKINVIALCKILPAVNKTRLKNYENAVTLYIIVRQRKQ